MIAERSLNPLWQQDDSTASSVRDLICEPCEIETARRLNQAWHSRLPDTQTGPWQYAFAAHKNGWVYAVALWHNPSARMLPSHWLELRRLAVADDAPHCCASWMLARMRQWFRHNAANRERLISYQDKDVHTGTIYRAAGWTAAYESSPRVRDRSKPRVGTRRSYRSNLNGSPADAAGKVRWEITL